jgi:hypothetical protein
MATTKLAPDVSLPDDVLDALADALATMLVLEMENVVVEAEPSDVRKYEQDGKVNQPHSRRRR